MSEVIGAVPLFGVVGGDVKMIELEDVNQYLSFKDLEGVVGFTSCKETQNKEELERILWEHGADITKPFYIRKCAHRPRTSNIPYDGFRVEFSERLDEAWLRGGAASEEAKLFTTDASLSEMLSSLDPRNARNIKRDYDEDVAVSVDIPEVEDAGEDSV